MSKILSKLKEEFLALLPPTIFFFVALHIVAFICVLMLKDTGISPLSSVSIAVAGGSYSRQSRATRGHAADDQSFSQ